jgi:nucleoside 2-deoxyribosyltransferase
MRVYLAAPLFSPAEREFIELLASRIESVADVYVPHRDGHLVEADIACGIDRADAYRNVYQRDIDEIRVCDVLLAVLDGRTPDEGVCIEMGFAKALGKSIVALKTDVRVSLPWGNNPMVDGCVDRWAKTHNEVVELLAAEGEFKPISGLIDHSGRQVP